MNPIEQVSSPSSSSKPMQILGKRKREERIKKFAQNKILKINQMRPVEMSREDAFELGMATQRLMAVQSLLQSSKEGSEVALNALGIQQVNDSPNIDSRIKYQLHHLQLLLKNIRRKQLAFDFAREIVSQFSDEKSEDHIPLEPVQYVEEIFQQFESEGLFQSLESEISESKQDEGFEETVEGNEEDALALTRNRLSHLLFVVQEEPNEAVKIISENNFPQAIKRLNAKSRTYLSRAKKALVIHDLSHKNVSIQDADRALFHKMSVEMSKLLLLKTGGVNFGMIEDMEHLIPERFIDTVAIHHLYFILADLQHNQSIWSQIEEIRPPKSKHIASDSAIRVALGLSHEELITKRHAQIFVLSALLGHLRQANAGTCFATACLIKAQFSNSKVFVEDLIQMTEHGYIERIVNGVLTKFPFIERVTNEHLNTIITLGTKGQILNTQCYGLIPDREDHFPKTQKGHYLYDSPGIISACMALKIKNINEAVLTAQSWLPKTFSVNCLLKQLAKFSHSSQLNSHQLRSEKNRSEEELLAKAQFAFGAQTNHPLHRAYEQTAASMPPIFGSQYGMNIAMIEIMREIIDHSFSHLSKDEKKIYDEILDESFLPMMTRMRYQYNPHVDDAELLFNNHSYGTVSHSNYGYELYDTGLPKDFIYSTNVLRAFHKKLTQVKPHTFVEFPPTHEWKSIGTPEKFQRFLQDVILKTAEYLGGGYKYTPRAEALCREVASLKFIKKMITEVYDQLGSSRMLKRNAHNIESKPWVFKWGGDFNAVLKTYFGFRSAPSKMKRFNGTPKEVLAKCMNFLKKQPDDLKESYRDPRNPIIVKSPVHAFLLRGSEESFQAAWQSDLSTNDYIKKHVEIPGKALANRSLSRRETQLIIDFIAENSWPCRAHEKNDWVRQELTEKSKEIFDQLIENHPSPSVETITNIVCISRAQDPKIGERNKMWESYFTRIFDNYSVTLDIKDPNRIKKLMHFARNRKDSRALSKNASAQFLNQMKQLPAGITIKEFRNKVLDAAYKAHCSDIKNEDPGWIKALSPYLDTKIVSVLPNEVQERLIDSGIVTHDTNWTIGIYNIHFIFLVNPATEEIELAKYIPDLEEIHFMRQEPWFPKGENHGCWGFPDNYRAWKETPKFGLAKHIILPELRKA